MSIEDEVRPVESEVLQMSQCQPKHTGIKCAYLIVASALSSAWHEVEALEFANSMLRQWPFNCPEERETGEKARTHQLSWCYFPAYASKLPGWSDRTAAMQTDRGVLAPAGCMN